MSSQPSPSGGALPPAPPALSRQNHSMGLEAKGFIDWLSRIYESKEAALFDLLDNADDATFKKSRLKSSKWIEVTPKINLRSGQTNCLSIMNGIDPQCLLSIKNILSFALSSKKGTSEIGENGVGLKQSVCYLCDSGLVVTRKGTTISLGLISSKLNEQIGSVSADEGVTFPRITFEVPENDPNPSVETIGKLLEQADKSGDEWKLTKWKKVRSCYGRGHDYLN